MSRRKIRGFSKQPVENILIRPEVRERKVLTNPITGDIEVVHIVMPAVYKKGRAQGPTTTKGKKNHMHVKSPQGNKDAKPGKGGKK